MNHSLTTHIVMNQRELSHLPNHLLNKSEFVTDNNVQPAALHTACTNFVFPAKNVTCTNRALIKTSKIANVDAASIVLVQSVSNFSVMVRFPVPGGPYRRTNKCMK